MKNPKPAWWLLYALLPLAAVLLIAAAIECPSAGGRECLEGMVSLAVIGAIAVWVRANRVALILEDHQQDPDRVDTRSMRRGVNSHEYVIAACRIMPDTEVGVGIMVAHDPLHRSGRAALPHPALALGDDAEATSG